MFTIETAIHEVKPGDKVLLPGSKTKWTVTSVDKRGLFATYRNRKSRLIAKTVTRVITNLSEVTR